MAQPTAAGAPTMAHPSSATRRPLLAGLAATPLVAPPARARRGFPDRPVRFVVPCGAGGRLGDVAFFAPGERHRHGATATAAMGHLAIGGVQDGRRADWMEHVADEDHLARASSPGRRSARTAAGTMP